ncbi:MAG: serine/threonine-protein kinase, partial [Myxococcota bacterium]
GQDGFQRLVAIKRILPEYSHDPSFIEMFKDEARIAGSLIHPNIVQIYELGEVKGTYYISMEYIEGIDLARIIKIRRALQQPIALEMILSICIAVCQALRYAHEENDLDGHPLNMIHRDVTPHNVLLSTKGEIKLTDFGIAKAAQNLSKTNVGELKGKLSYMSPEQAQGSFLDKRSDIYQVGIMLYELSTLKKMFEGNSDQTLLDRISHNQFTPPRTIAPNLSPMLEKIIYKALAHEPHERYQNAGQLAQALIHLKDQQQSPSHRFDVAPFVKEILVQRQQLLEQFQHPKRAPQPHTQQPPHPQSPFPPKPKTIPIPKAPAPRNPPPLAIKKKSRSPTFLPFLLMGTLLALVFLALLWTLLFHRPTP